MVTQPSPLRQHFFQHGGMVRDDVVHSQVNEMLHSGPVINGPYVHLFAHAMHPIDQRRRCFAGFHAEHFNIKFSEVADALRNDMTNGDTPVRARPRGRWRGRATRAGCGSPAPWRR